MLKVLLTIGLVTGTLAYVNQLRSQVIADEFHWNEKVPYAFVTSGSQAVSTSQQEHFRNAAKYIQERTCLDFVEAAPVSAVDDVEDIIHVYQSPGNCLYRSSMPMIPEHINGAPHWAKYHKINVAACDDIGGMHEILHALGAQHENERPDALQFVTDQEENLSDVFETFGLPYDFASMVTNSIEPKHPLLRTFSRPNVPSFIDLLGANAFNKCLKSCRQSPSAAKCLNGGYNHPRDCKKCVCPDGLVGDNCELKAQGDGVVINVDKDFKDYDVKSTTGKKSVYVLKAPNATSIEFQFTQIDIRSRVFSCTVPMYLPVFLSRRAPPVPICNKDQLNKSFVAQLNEVPLIVSDGGAYKIKVRAVNFAHIEDGSKFECFDFYKECPRRVKDKVVSCEKVDDLDFHPCRKSCDLCRRPSNCGLFGGNSCVMMTDITGYETAPKWFDN